MVHKKIMHVLITVMLFLLTILPSQSVLANAQGISTLGDNPSAWPTTFSPYTNSGGSVILDPAGDVHPIDVDITSGVDREKGALPSMFVASDGDDFFVRLRLKGDPYDRKGGFLSSVWLVQLAVGGKHKATIGLNGKSPATDYVYVANADGSIVQPIYATSTVGGNTVPGTQIVEAENGQYFLDFQVPISRIAEVAPGITGNSDIQLFFGTSKAANLSVINKEFMDTGSNNGSSVNFQGLSVVKLNEQPLSVAIDGGSSKSYSSTNKKMSGTTSIDSGQVTISINNGFQETLQVTNHIWNYTLPDTIYSSNGIHKATVTALSGEKMATAKQDIVIEGNTDTLTINGGAVATTSSTNPTISGTFASTTSRNNFEINLYVSETSNSLGTSYKSSIDAGTWTKQITLSNPINNKVYYLTTEWIENGNNKTPYAITKQQLTYKQGATINPIAVAISSITGDAQPVISGTSTGTELVEVRVDGVSTEFVKPGSDGKWSLSALEKPLSSGSHTITAIVSNAFGNTAVASKMHSVSATTITIDNGDKVTINDNRPTLRGNTNAANGSTVTVNIVNHGSMTTTAQNGRWKVEVPDQSPIPDGTHTVTTTVNSATATQQLTIDSSTDVSILLPAKNSQTTDLTPVFSGKAEKGASLSLKLEKSNEDFVWIENLVADSSGNWLFTPTTDLALGDYTINILAADAYGNEAMDSSNFNISDNTKPTKIQVTGIDPTTVTVDNGTSLVEAKAKLPAKVSVQLAEGDPRQINVSWSEESVPSYDGTTAGQYVFTGTLVNLPEDVSNDSHFTASGEVTVSPAPKSGTEILTYAFKGLSATASIDPANHQIQIELPYDADVTNLIAEFTLSEGATATIGEIAQQSGVTVNDFTVQKLYTVTAENDTKEVWTIIVNLAEQGQSAQPVVTSPTPVREGDKTLIGTAEAGAVVTIKIGDREPRTATADKDGNWQIDDLTLLKDDVLTIFSKAPDKKESSALVITVLEKLKNIQSFSPITVKIFKGTNADTVISLLGSTVDANLDNNSTRTIPVTWNLNDQDLNSSGSIQLTGTIGSLPENVVNPNQLQPAATINVVEDLDLRGSTGGKKTVTVTGAQPGATVKLYDRNNELVYTEQANDNGLLTFTNVEVGTGYYVTQSMGSLISLNSAPVNVSARAVNDLVIHGSMDDAKTVSIENALPGATIVLYDKNDQFIQSSTADSSGIALFTAVPTDINYYATQVIDGDETEPSKKVDVFPKIKIRFSEGDIWESVTKPVFVVDQLLTTPIVWSSSNPQVLNISDSLVPTQGSSVREYVVDVNRQDQDTSVILTAKLLFEGRQVERTFLLVVKGKRYNINKVTETSGNHVTLGGQQITQGIEVTRTTLNDSSSQPLQRVDKLIISESANLGSGDVSLHFDDTPNTGIKADEQAVEMSLEALRKLDGSLTIVTPEGTVQLPQASLSSMTDAGLDLFFRIVPMRSSEQKQEVIDRTKSMMQVAAGSNKTVQVLDIPREIETNYTGFETEIILPLKGMNLTAQHVSNLRLFIEHTNGTKEVIVPGTNGEIIYENGLPAGLKFSIDHFSTFTFFQVSDIVPTPIPTPPTNSGGDSGVSQPVEKIVNQINAPMKSEVIAGKPFNVEGKTIASTNVAIFIDDQWVANVQSDKQGNWSYEIKNGLAAGVHKIKTTIKDLTGNELVSNIITWTIVNEKEIGTHIKYINGFKDGTFRPNESVTRVQMAAMMSRILSGGNIPVASSINYSDISKSWAKDEIEFARSQEIILGYNNGKFGPNDHITRAQMAVVAMRWIDKHCAKNPQYAAFCKSDKSVITYTDVQPSHWAKNSIERISRTGIMNGFADGTFHPDEKLTRAQAVKVLNSLFLRGPLEGVANPTFPDAPTNHWAFKDIEEAATNHEFELKDGLEFLVK
ncbi:S-layer homology domain-containing protein [Bacillus sp. CGMCC 1.16607]|uniref:S-layer homology domain-containing protein n=1 Tax=Bacillus sp. CGMCC 1.16607 TaxID=3351842 RepID=UPI003641DA21